MQSCLTIFLINKTYHSHAQWTKAAYQTGKCIEFCSCCMESRTTCSHSPVAYIHSFQVGHRVDQGPNICMSFLLLDEIHIFIFMPGVECTMLLSLYFIMHSNQTSIYGTYVAPSAQNVRVMPHLELIILKNTQLSAFSPTCFDKLSWNLVYNFVSLYYRSISSAVNFRHLCRSYASFWNLKYWKYTVFWAFWLCFTVLKIKFECHQIASNFVGVMPRLELTILEIHVLPHFSPTCVDILSRNFANNFVSLYYRSIPSVVNLCDFCMSYTQFWNLLEIHNFLNFSPTFVHALAYWSEILYLALIEWTSDQVRV